MIYLYKISKIKIYKKKMCGGGLELVRFIFTINPSLIFFLI